RAGRGARRRRSGGTTDGARRMSLAPPHARPPMLAEAVVAAAAALRDTSPTARLDAEILTMHVADVSRSDLIAHADRPLTASQTAALDALVARRHTGEPI